MLTPEPVHTVAKVASALNVSMETVRRRIASDEQEAISSGADASGGSTAAIYAKPLCVAWRRWLRAMSSGSVAVGKHCTMRSRTLTRMLKPC